MNSRFLLISCFTLFMALVPSTALAYPEFIGYGYVSCVTCHYNTQGNGPLNDYGRALFASEISSRSFFPETVTDEDLAEASGFLGKKQLPWWLRPSFKYRGLLYRTNPGSSESRSRFIVMQEDFNLTLILDQEQRYIVSGNIGVGYHQSPGEPEPTKVWLSREHYFRWNLFEKLYLTIGMMDKVFGLRLIDHTAFSRTRLDINQYRNISGTLTHGIVAHWIESEWELTGHGFIGNLNEEENLRKRGGSLMSEFTMGENKRVGFSVLTEGSPTAKQNAFAAHGKLAVSHGSALLLEAGFHKKEDSSTMSNLSGYYAFAQTTVLLKRGYNLLSVAEFYKSKQDEHDLPEMYRWGVGLLCFPLPRVEIRLIGQDLRYWSQDKGDKDSWNAQAQLHLSF